MLGLKLIDVCKIGPLVNNLLVKSLWNITSICISRDLSTQNDKQKHADGAVSTER